MNALSTEQLQKIVDILQMNNEKGKTNNDMTDQPLDKGKTHKKILDS